MFVRKSIFALNFKTPHKSSSEPYILLYRFSDHPALALKAHGRLIERAFWLVTQSEEFG
jgi:hypothetical protein